MNNDFSKIDKNTINAARRGDAEALMSNLSENDREKINDVLADKDKLKQILNSDAAKNIMKILGGNKNG